jgi:hypothetical protein
MNYKEKLQGEQKKDAWTGILRYFVHNRHANAKCISDAFVASSASSTTARLSGDCFSISDSTEPWSLRWKTHQEQ